MFNGIQFNKISFWKKLQLMFVRPDSYWSHEEKLVTKFKVLRGVTYILAQEPLQYGDSRNAQIDRMESWL